MNKIKNWAFQYCQKLVEVRNESLLTLTKGDKGNGYVAYYAKVIHNGESLLVRQDNFIFYTEDSTNYLLGYDGTATELSLPQSFNGSEYIVYKYAFSFRPELTKVYIPEGAKTIQGYIFEYCTNLSELTLGKSVRTIEKYAVSNCPSFSKVIYLGTQEEYNAITIETPNALLNNAVKVFN